jgi:hypothetical protein
MRIPIRKASIVVDGFDDKFSRLQFLRGAAKEEILETDDENGHGALLAVFKPVLVPTNKSYWDPKLTILGEGVAPWKERLTN